MLINSGSSCGVFWQVGSSATLGTGTSFAGSILGAHEHHAHHRRRRDGPSLARNGAVTLDDSHVTLCAGGPPFPSGTPAVPTLSGWALLSLTGLLALAGLMTVRRRALPARL